MIDRRRWITGLGIAAGVTVLAGSGRLARALSSDAPLAPPVAFGGALYRGTQDGRILCSRDDGASWETHDDFGAHCRVVELGATDGGLVAQLSVQGHRFRLTTRDAVRWRA